MSAPTRLRRIALPIFAAAAVVTAPAAGPSDAFACTKAKIGGSTKCIARGQYCARSHERDYERYGYTCTKKDRKGRYHLE